MTDAIDYKDNGTIVITLDKKHTLRGPSADEMLRWHEAILKRQDDVYVELDQLRADVEAAKADTPEQRAAERAMSAFSRRPSYEFTLSWLEDVVAALSDDFPSREQWPAFLANQTLPAAFVKHWQDNPKVSGLNEKK